MGRVGIGALAHRQIAPGALKWPFEPCRFGHGVRRLNLFALHQLEHSMNSIIYIVGLVVIVLAALSFFGLR